jgi:glucosamine--fructose-6-phosphate aminotransferase (isomerizing)
MIREIHEQPKVIKATITKENRQVAEVAKAIYDSKYEMVYLTGSGTSYHASLVGAFSLSTLTGLICNSIPASEFEAWLPSTVPRKSILIEISQSGESTDVLEAARLALKRNMKVIAITNTPQSSLAKIADYILMTHAGKELAVTATKTYTTQLTLLFMLTLELANLQGQRKEDVKRLKITLSKTPKLASETLILNEDLMREFAYDFKHVNCFFLLGSGPNYATALEGALKLKEACNIFAEGFACREFLHGPIQLIGGQTPIILIMTKDELEDFKGLVKTIVNFGAPLIPISERTSTFPNLSVEGAQIPEGFPKIFSPILYIIPLQLLAYYSSIARNLNPDKPEKLKKVVK